MKKLLAILILLTCMTGLHAQKYIVYAITGDITLTEGRTHKAVVVRQKLTPNDNLSIPDKGIIRLFDHANKKLYTLKGKCSGAIGTLIKTQSDSEKTVTPQYFAYIIKNLKGGLVTNTVETDNATYIFRDQMDSLFVSPDKCPPTTPADSVSGCKTDSVCKPSIHKNTLP